MAIGGRKPTKRDVDALKTRTKIFDTAIMLFAQHGFDTVTVDDITRIAGVSKGTFYTHFPSKDSVLVEQFHQIDDSYAAAFESIDPNTSASDQLRLFLDTMCDYCTNICGVNVMKVVYMNQISLGDRKRILIDSETREIYSRMRKIVAQGRKTGEFKTQMPEDVLVEFLVSEARALIFNWCLYDGEISMKEMAIPMSEALTEWLTLER